MSVEGVGRGDDGALLANGDPLRGGTATVGDAPEGSRDAGGAREPLLLSVGGRERGRK